MKSKMFKKLMAAALATTMIASLTACGPAEDGNTSQPTGGGGDDTGSTPTSQEPSGDNNTDPGEEVSEWGAPLRDENGNIYDLGGMEIVIRDWWSSEDVAEPTTEFEEKTQEYREWIQETYNFKIKQVQISSWGSALDDFQDYYNTGGDDNNYVFTLRSDGSLINMMASGMMYDLATLDCLDFKEQKFQDNGVHELYASGKSIYAMYSGPSEPRTGIYFNKTLLKNAGYDGDDPYKWQANGEWTWAKFEEVCAAVQVDRDGDGNPDAYALNANDGMFTNMAVFSNGGEYVGRDDATGKYLYKLEDAKTVEGLEWADKMFKEYWQKNEPVDENGNAIWDYYKQAFVDGEYAFMVEDAYVGQNNFLAGQGDIVDFGFVMFPKNQDNNNFTKYVFKADNNPAVIPSVYDADRAWKIAFAWNLYTNDTPGYEGQDTSWKGSYYNGFADTEAIDQTLVMMRESGRSLNAYHLVIPNLQEGPELTWKVGPTGGPISTIIEETAPAWKGYIDELNAKIK